MAKYQSQNEDPRPLRQLSSKEVSAEQAYRRYQESWDLAHLSTAIDLYQQAVDDAAPANAGLLSDLGSHLSVYYDRVGDVNALERAIKAQREALKLASDASYRDHARCLHNLATSYQDRFMRNGDADDLERAIKMQQRAVEIIPDDHPSMPIYLDTLGLSQSLRYRRFGHLDDLEHAIRDQRRAFELSEGHPNESIRLNNLGWSLRIRFQRLGELSDLDLAISMQSRAVELTPPGHPDLASYLENLSFSQDLRYEHRGDLKDLEDAITGLDRALELTPDGYPAKVVRLNNLGTSLHKRFERLDEASDFERAIAMVRRAVELTSSDQPAAPERMGNLGALYYLRYRKFGNADDLEHAITMQSQALELLPDGHPDKPMWLKNLSHSLAVRFRLTKAKTDFNEAVSSFMTVTSQTLGPPITRINAADFLVKFMEEHPDYCTQETLLAAHSRTLDMIPELVWLGHNISRRFEESRRFGSLVTAAVRASVTAGALTQAIEWLEAGRSFMWSQILSLRTSADELRDHDPELARSLKRIHSQLQASIHTAPRVESASTSDDAIRISNPEADRHRMLVLEYEDVLKEARRRPGLEDFMRPMKLAAIVPPSVSLHGPVVFINVDQVRCDAIIFAADRSISIVALPELSLEKTEKLRSLWQSYLHQQHVRERAAVPRTQHRTANVSALRVLSYLWGWAMHPILDALGFAVVQQDGGRLPHVTWCPTGALTQLPLHAAGVYDQDSGPHVYDFVVSSYTPSLAALARSSKGMSQRSTSASGNSVLVVTQPDTPGLSPLPGALIEEQCLRDVFSATPDSLSVFAGAQALTSTNLADPMKSAFALYDGQLSLADLMGTTAETAELAFLSACQTAVGDETSPEESMHLAAGMLAAGFKGVVATMWSIRDDDAPFIVEAYYKKLLVLRANGSLSEGETGAAYTLHEATQQLRKKVGEQEFSRWAPFVHFGA
ncbi:unnamed protein product [Peniophora sp. CBMAI 1063]|nr:unnamed protein product [Peniophora sp. CBMAI 1063]